VAVLLERLQNEQTLSFKEAVNSALRLGLRQLETLRSGGNMYRTTSVSLGRCLQASLDDVAEVLAVAEGKTSDDPRGCQPSGLRHVRSMTQHARARSWFDER